jgi:hypothetical protein
MWAVDDPEKTLLLLEHGATVDVRSEDGQTALLLLHADPYIIERRLFGALIDEEENLIDEEENKLL